MKVRVIREISVPRGTIPAGRIIEISSAMVEKLRGKVEPVTAEAPPPAKPDPLPRSCRWCGSTDLWQIASKYPQWRCRRCHPPAPGVEDISVRPQQASQDALQGLNEPRDIVTLAPFVCRACGSTSWRQGIVARICRDCQVPEKDQP